MKGIEYCVNLSSLYCSYNHLTYLKIIEHYVNLKELHCSYNQLTSLKEIEDLHNLTMLWCFNNPISFRCLYLSLKDFKTIEYINRTTFNEYINNLKIEALKETLNMINL